MPARGDQLADLRILGRLGVEVERLRVPFAGESDDFLFGDQAVAEHDDLADGEILEKTALGRSLGSHDRERRG